MCGIGPCSASEPRSAACLREGGNVGFARRDPAKPGVNMTTMHDFEMKSITGEPVKLSQYRDKVCLIVNVATK